MSERDYDDGFNTRREFVLSSRDGRRGARSGSSRERKEGGEKRRKRKEEEVGVEEEEREPPLASSAFPKSRLSFFFSLSPSPLSFLFIFFAASTSHSVFQRFCDQETRTQSER